VVGQGDEVEFVRRGSRDHWAANVARAWLIDDGQKLLGAVFTIEVAKGVREAINRQGAVLDIDRLSARLPEKNATSIEVLLCKADEVKHRMPLDPGAARALLFSVLEALEELFEHSAKTAPASSGDQRNARIERVKLASAFWELLCWHRGDAAYPDVVVDFLAHARRYCDAHGLDFGALDRQAYGTYLVSVYERWSAAQASAAHCLHVPSGAWQDVSEYQDESILQMIVLVEGVSHQLMATEVRMRDSVQCAADQRHDESLAQMRACGASGPFQTVSIRGRDYVLTMTPHSD
jgi:hypothetical protein